MGVTKLDFEFYRSKLKIKGVFNRLYRLCQENDHNLFINDEPFIWDQSWNINVKMKEL